MSRRVNKVWQDLLSESLLRSDYETKPRGMVVRELVNGSYKVPMPAYLSLSRRKVNYSFMFAEAAWIISGNNRASTITQFMKGYKNFSDDGVFLRGAYGPKVVDQLGYVVDTLEKDNDSRQAVLTIWRERPATSKDIPCTLAMQFLIRDDKLHLVTTMRSNDIVLGFTYDVFTFSMVAMAVQKLLAQRDIRVDLGDLYVNAGSLHLYEQHFEDAIEWYTNHETTNEVTVQVKSLANTETYDDLIDTLWELAKEMKNAKRNNT